MLATGLTNLEDNTLALKGDASLDIVYLDGCMTWEGPAASPAGSGALRYVGRSNDSGATVNVDIMKGLQIRYLQPERLMQWVSENRSDFAPLQRR